MELFTALMDSTIRMTTPLLIVSLGLVISERSGLMQITAEGFLVLGAFVGYLGVAKIGLGFFASVLLSMLIAILFNTIFMVSTITLPCKQVIIGTGMNMFLPGLCTFLYRKLIISDTDDIIRFDVMSTVPIPILSNIPVIGSILFNKTYFTYFAYIMIFVTWFVLYHTSWGTKIIAVGEYPKVAESVGIKVRMVRYGTAAFSAAMFAVAGSNLSLAQSGVYVDDMGGGRGFIAMAIVIMGRWNPFGALLGSLLFGFTSAVQIYMQAKGVPLPSNIILMIPYISVLIVVIIFSKKKAASPSALGVPY